MSEHTPGPWRLRMIDSGMCNGVAIGATVLPPEPFTGPPIAEVGSSIANARLIVAAPDLLEALRPFAAREECEIGVRPSEDDDLHNQACGECGTILIARRAIAKAEGR